MEKAMKTVICEPRPRSEVIACIADLRAFAMELTGDRLHADDLACGAIEQTFAAVSQSRTRGELKVRMFGALHTLYFAARTSSLEAPARLREPPLSKDDGTGSDEIISIFDRLGDEQREALILTLASGLSHKQAAEVCQCHVDVIKSRVSEGWREISLALAASPGRKSNSPSFAERPAVESRIDEICAA
jgi:RNA polymerase sigma-70 factor, ECF subfamily